MGQEVGELDMGGWGGGGNQKYAGLEDHVVIFSHLSFFSFPFSPLTDKAIPPPSDAHYANFQGSSFDRDVHFP